MYFHRSRAIYTYTVIWVKGLWISSLKWGRPFQSVGVPSDTCMGVVMRMAKITITVTLLTFTMVILAKEKQMNVEGVPNTLHWLAKCDTREWWRWPLTSLYSSRLSESPDPTLRMIFPFQWKWQVVTEIVGGLGVERVAKWGKSDNLQLFFFSVS